MSVILSFPRGVEVTSPAPKDAWLDISRQDPNTLVYQIPSWTEAACATGEYMDASRLYEMPNGHRLLLPLLQNKRSLPGFTSQASLPPGWGQGGLLSTHPLVDEDLQTVWADLVRQPVMRTLLSPNPLLASVWDRGLPRGLATVSRTAHILDLEGGFEKVWKDRIESKTRTAIRKAERSNLTVTWDTTGKYVPVFYDLFLQWAARRGRERHLPAWAAQWNNQRRDPLQRFECIAQALGEACQIYVAWLDGQPIAASILLIFRNNAFSYRSTSIKELAHPVRANDLLQSLMIQEACRVGCRHYYRGESGGVASLERYKSGFGAVPVSFRDYAIERLPLTEVNQRVNGVMKWVEHRLIQASG